MESQEATVFFAETKAEFKDAVLHCVESMGGKHLKSLGTTHLCIFSDPEAACRAALHLKKMEGPISFRVGIVRGMVTLTRGDALGEAVNTAARLQGIAKPQEIYLSQSVFEAIEHDLFPLRDLGTRQFKGLAQPVHLYSLEKNRSTPIQAKPVKSATETKPTAPKDLFDFSRVDHERLQDDDAVRASLPERIPESASIPLAVKPQVGDVARKKDGTPRTNPEFVIANRKRQVKTKIIMAIAIPVSVAVFVSMALRATSKLPKPKPPVAVKSNALEEKIKKSEVIQSIQDRKKAKAAVYSTLKIETSPDGAQVYINETAVGKTPVKINKVPPRTALTLKIVKPGYDDNLQFLNLQPEEEKVVEVKLHKK